MRALSRWAGTVSTLSKSLFSGESHAQLTVELSVLNDADNVFIFMGEDDNPLPDINDFQFWAASYLGGKRYEWPATTINEEVIAELCKMEVGQIFRVTKKEDVLGIDDGWGVHVAEIDMNWREYPKATIDMLSPERDGMEIL